jgi:hypothetical protein
MVTLTVILDLRRRARAQVLLEDAALLTDWQRRQAEYKAKRKLTGKREADILSRLTAFQTKVPPHVRAGPRLMTGTRVLLRVICMRGRF